MATSPGQRFVRRHNAARSSTANATAADIGYDTAVLSEGGYSWSSPEVTVDEDGLYLAIFDLGQVDLASTRAVGTLVLSVNSVDRTRFRATHRYLRNSGGSQEGASIGMAILDLSASDAVKVRNPGALTPTDAVGNYATNAGIGGALQLIRLPAGNFTHVERTTDAAEVGTSNINTTRPWLDSSGTWATITYDSEVQDDDGLYPGTGGDITLAAGKKYIVLWGATIYSTGGSRHTDVVRLQIGGTNVQSGSGYQRNTASQGPPICGMYLHEVGGSAETLRLQATHETEGGDAGTPQVSDAYVQVLELPDTAEWVHVDNGATDSLTTALAGLTTWYDTPLSSTLRSDGNGDLSLDAANDAVQNDSGGSLPVLAIGWHRWDRDAGTSGTRKNPWTRFLNGASAVGYAVASAFSRGQQSTDDTWQAHMCAAATLDLADGDDLKFQVQDEASGANADMGIYASTSRYFLGLQVLNLNTLAGSAGTVYEHSAAAEGVGATSVSMDVIEPTGTVYENAATAAGLGSASVSLAVTRAVELEAATAGQAGASAAVGAVRALSAAADGVAGTATSIESGAAFELSASAGGAASTSSVLGAVRSVEARADGLGVASAAIEVVEFSGTTHTLSADASGLGTADAVGSALRSVAAESGGLAAVAAVVLRRRVLGASADGVAATSAEVERATQPVGLFPTAEGAGEASAAVAVVRSMGAVAAGAGSSTAGIEGGTEYVATTKARGKRFLWDSPSIPGAAVANSRSRFSMRSTGRARATATAEAARRLGFWGRATGAVAVEGGSSSRFDVAGRAAVGARPVARSASTLILDGTAGGLVLGSARGRAGFVFESNASAGVEARAVSLSTLRLTGSARVATPRPPDDEDELIALAYLLLDAA